MFWRAETQGAEQIFCNFKQQHNTNNINISIQIVWASHFWCVKKTPWCVKYYVSQFSRLFYIISIQTIYIY